jgi:hypothetical protein
MKYRFLFSYSGGQVIEVEADNQAEGETKAMEEWEREWKIYVLQDVANDNIETSGESPELCE